MERRLEQRIFAQDIFAQAAIRPVVGFLDSSQLELMHVARRSHFPKLQQVTEKHERLAWVCLPERLEHLARMIEPRQGSEDPLL